MTIAFYAPLKAPTHATPSGDRAMARAVLKALEAANLPVRTVSNLRLYDRDGSTSVQRELQAQAKAETNRLLASSEAPAWRAWVTYHNYYKAPDLIGPGVAKALAIPYVLIEATRARKRLSGPWAQFAAAAEAACDAADAIFYLTHRDAEALEHDAPEGQKLVHLRPFLARTDLPPQSDLSGPMLSVGMFRPGDKLASYQLIADTLAGMGRGSWHLDVVGDGSARAPIEALMAPFGDHVTLHGALGSEALERMYAQASLLLWPGVNEAFGLTYLEAQAAGVPVVAQDRLGVCDVVFGDHPPPRAGPEALAKAARRLIDDPAHRAAQGAAARAHVARHHLLSAAANTLAATLNPLIGGAR